MRNLSTKLNGNTTGMNYEQEVLRFMKANDIDDLYLISVDSKRYHGKYGCLVETWYDGSKHWYCNPRKVYKLIKQYYNVNRLEKKIYEREDDDGYYIIEKTHFMFDRDYAKIFYTKHDDGSITNLIRLSNGQLYDIEDRYWYSMKDSKELKQAIKNSYPYIDVNTWQYDNYESEGAKIQRLEIEATEKLIRSSIDNLLSNPEFKEKANAVAQWINNNPEILPRDKEFEDKAFKNYVYGFTPQYILFSVRADLTHMWINSTTKPVYAKHLVKNKVEFDYAGRILKDPKACLDVLRKNFPKLDKVIDERLSDPFNSVTLEDLENTSLPVSNIDWDSSMREIYNKLGFSCTHKPMHEVLM